MAEENEIEGVVTSKTDRKKIKQNCGNLNKSGQQELKYLTAVS